jgi:hypothetical protein
LAIKTPPPKKKTPKKPLKMDFLGFFLFLIFYGIRHKLSFIYKIIVRYLHSIKNISERNKIDTQSRADAYIRRKRLISKSDYNLTSGCT